MSLNTLPSLYEVKTAQLSDYLILLALHVQSYANENNFLKLSLCETHILHLPNFLSRILAFNRIKLP